MFIFEGICISFFQKKLVGTKVTVENFMAWKMEFDAKRLEGKLRKNKDGKEKLTGRELFTQNATLNESDIQFISSGKLCLLLLIIYYNINMIAIMLVEILIIFYKKYIITLHLLYIFRRKC